MALPPGAAVENFQMPEEIALRIMPGGQARYSDLAVKTALMLRAVVLKQMLDLGRPESVRDG